MAQFLCSHILWNKIFEKMREILGDPLLLQPRDIDIIGDIFNHDQADLAEFLAFVCIFLTHTNMLTGNELELSSVRQLKDRVMASSAENATILREAGIPIRNEEVEALFSRIQNAA